MEVHLVMLDSLREELAVLNKQDFSGRYGGAFLLAMGFLSASQIRDKDAERRRRIERGGVGEIDATASFQFSPRRRHDAGQSHPLAGCAFHLKPEGDRSVLTVGRNKASDITVPDNGVSEDHCRIELTSEGVVVVDLGSTNGTSINLRLLEAGVPSVLADEDILSVGRYSFQMLTTPTFYTEMQPLAFDDLLGE